MDEGYFKRQQEEYIKYISESVACAIQELIDAHQGPDDYEKMMRRMREITNTLDFEEHYRLQEELIADDIAYELVR